MAMTTFTDDLKHVARHTVAEARRRVQLTILRWHALPTDSKKKIAAGIAAAALLGGGLALRGSSSDASRRTPVAIRSEARSTLADVRPPTRAAERSYAVGKVEESQGSYKAAAESYAEAARKGNARALNKLVAMTHAPKCEARSEAADALGTVHDKRARLALRKLANGRFKDESRTPGIFSCSSRRAAEKALEKQRG